MHTFTYALQPLTSLATRIFTIYLNAVIEFVPLWLQPNFSTYNFRCNFNPLYLFLIVTSVTPAASATSFWVLFSPFITQATYNAAAASPIGSLPAEILPSSAFFRISRALRFVFSDRPALLAILATHFTGSTTGILRSNSLMSNR